MRRLLVSLLICCGALPALAMPAWQFDNGEAVAFLHYGDGAESQLGFFCSPGFGTVGIYAEIPGVAIAEGGGAKLAITAAGQRFTYDAGMVQAGLQVMVGADDPVMVAFASGGSAILEAEGKSLEVPLAGADVAGLARACRGL